MKKRGPRKKSRLEHRLVFALRIIANNAEQLIDDINLGLLQNAKTLIRAGLIHRQSEYLNQLVSESSSHSRKRLQAKRIRKRGA